MPSFAIMSDHRYYIIYKPCNMLSQFIGTESTSLADLDFDFPEGIHAIGRLDELSEGLLILTTNKKVTRLLFQGPVPHRRTYLVRVKNKVSPERLEKLRSGIPIIIKDGVEYTTGACDVHIVEKPQNLAPGRYDDLDHLPHTWLQLSLTEGKYHQVRKMVAAVHHKCQRLIRTSIEDLELGDLKPGEVKEIEEEAFFSLLKISPEQ